MVIIFSIERVRNFLIERGYVYTYRDHYRQHLGQDWATSGRGKPKICNVYIKVICRVVDAKALAPYAANSGFDTLSEWLSTIQILNRGKKLDGWLYRVEVKP